MRRLIYQVPYLHVEETDEELRALPFFRALGGRHESLYTKEPETIAWIDSFEAQDALMLDVGANIGCYTLYALSRRPSLRVVAVEPHGPSREKLVENVAMNGWGDRVTVVGCVLTNAIGKTGFSARAIAGTSDGRLVLGDTHDAMTIDALVESIGEIPHYIKIDVDGHEPSVISGARATLSSEECLSVLVELSERAAETDEMIRACGLMPHPLTLRRTRRDDRNVIYWRGRGLSERPPA